MSTSAELAQRVNLLVERLIHDRELLGRYRTSPGPLLDEAGITDPAARAALASGEQPALARLGMHPILMMHYLLALKPEIAAHMTIRHYPALVEGR